MSDESILYKIHKVTNVACPVCDATVPLENLCEHLDENHKVTNIVCPVCNTAVPPENLLEHLMYHIAMDDPIIVHGDNDRVYTFPLSYISKVMYEFDMAGGGTYLIFEWLKNPEIVEVLYTLYNNSIALPTKNDTL